MMSTDSGSHARLSPTTVPPFSPRASYESRRSRPSNDSELSVHSSSQIIVPRGRSSSSLPRERMVSDLEPHMASDAELRRRRLDKLTRTLGEDVPAELILGPGEKAEPRPRKNSTRRSASVSHSIARGYLQLQPPPPPLPISLPIDTPTTAPVQPSPPPDRPSRSILRRAKSFRSAKSPSRDRDYVHVRSETPFQDIQSDDEAMPNSGWVNGTNAVVRIEEKQGWSGAWNQHDMNDVVSKLRKLK